jgi:hypothetical protein
LRQGEVGGRGLGTSFLLQPNPLAGVCTPAGSGKTHTMSGHEDIISDESYNGHDKDGIISRAIQYLFHQVRLTLGRLLANCVFAHICITLPAESANAEVTLCRSRAGALITRQQSADACGTCLSLAAPACRSR